MTSLPTLEAIRGGPSDQNSPLGTALTILFEPSPILVTTLEPQLSTYLKSQPPSALPSYTHLIDISLDEIKRWGVPSQSEFISGHPRIGESKNLSALSSKEQGANMTVNPTPREVLARLKHLNACYEARYPGLRYITFVNGRSRAAIAEEIEGVLEIEHSLSPDSPPVDTFGLEPYGQSDQKWLSELKRAVEDVGRIAKSRLKALGAE